jgi:hypothetical protein
MSPSAISGQAVNINRRGIAIVVVAQHFQHAPIHLLDERFCSLREAVVLLLFHKFKHPNEYVGHFWW